MIYFYLIGFALVWILDKVSEKPEEKRKWSTIGKRLFFSSLSWLSIIGLIIHTIYPRPPKFL